MFGVLFRGRLYLKVDEQSKYDYESRGMEPFRPNERRALKSYCEVPPDVLAAPDALSSWGEEAVRAILVRRRGPRRRREPVNHGSGG
ncbi:TfoX/Sxy family protein [Paludisphaera borealis]|uniref:TfoX/Sxy family protein n=1 Tax=Paludisphaera borealis TaxID=1387353 RepID=UPI003B837DF5